VTGLNNVSFNIPKGQFVAVVGPSGSGKTTLLVTIGAMLRPTSGTVYIHDRAIYSLPMAEMAELRQKHIGFLFQTFNLIPYLTAQQNVMAPLMLANLPAEKQRARSAELLDRVGLGDRLDHKPNELSVGQQQRVALARMLANDPELILADEPTGNLDPQTAADALVFLGDLCKKEGKTIVMVTHSMEAAKKAGRILQCVNGVITES
jgi:putative ABC transport system ATP-binding protein